MHGEQAFGQHEAAIGAFGKRFPRSLGLAQRVEAKSADQHWTTFGGSRWIVDQRVRQQISPGGRDLSEALRSLAGQHVRVNRPSHQAKP